ncbi:MAG TPA: hypothetical protein VJ960_06390, partial [Oceanipulchritudo sp.]|nr:hypothetical protein [Oceanipulchritudo sp.]
MIQRPFSSPGYHTELKGGVVHETRGSFNYALNLLDSGEPEHFERAVDILRRVIALQDQSPDSPTYGIWSWFLEEPLETMEQPDFNWADFNGVTLLQISRDHLERLPEDLAKEVNDAILRACAAIKKRDVGPGYTNIALMGAYVTLVAGEHLNVPEFRDYGLARLSRFHAFTQENGAFEEYNSPTYTRVALEQLSRLKAHVQDGSAQAMIEPLLRQAWEEMARHFHAPTAQWAGPHSRAYSSLLRTDELAFIERACEGKIALPGAESSTHYQRHVPTCPPDLIPLFTELPSPRTEEDLFIKRSNTIGTTYLHPQYALGTINHGDLWNQRRHFLWHFGTAKEPGYLHLRFLKDNYDFASAKIESVQRDGNVLALVTFVTDGGDTHIALDMVKDARFRASDLRLRFELGGPASANAHISSPRKNEPAAIQVAGLDATINILQASLDGQQAHVETGGDHDKKWLDVILYSGDEREFNLETIKDAITAFAFSIGSTLPVEISEKEGQLILTADDLSVQSPIQPQKRR